MRVASRMKTRDVLTLAWNTHHKNSLCSTLTADEAEDKGCCC
jgi:hypothetical protein